RQKAKRRQAACKQLNCAWSFEILSTFFWSLYIIGEGRSSTGIMISDLLNACENPTSARKPLRVSFIKRRIRHNSVFMAESAHANSKFLQGHSTASKDIDVGHISETGLFQSIG